MWIKEFDVDNPYYHDINYTFLMIKYHFRDVFKFYYEFLKREKLLNQGSTKTDNHEIR